MWTRQMWHEFAFMSTARGGTIIKLFIECKTILKHKFKVEKIVGSLGHSIKSNIFFKLNLMWRTKFKELKENQVDYNGNK